eukprot:g3272.t1
MTKPVVSVALMMLLEEGKIQLSDPVYKYLGEAWKRQNMRVFRKYNPVTGALETERARKNITIKMLLTHTSGITYGFDVKGAVNKVDKIFNERLRKSNSATSSLAHFCEFVPEIPLVFQPGTAWLYGYNTDIVGRLIEVVSGQSLETFLKNRIFDPLGMEDTSFSVPLEKRARFSSCYMRKGQKLGMLSLGSSPSERGLTNVDKLLGRFEKMTDPLANAPFMSGGGGLVGTVDDYVRFCECLRKGGYPLLGRQTVRYMVSNHLACAEEPDRDMNAMQRTLPFYNSGYTEMGGPGIGFGLGFAVTMREELCPYLSRNGAYSWGGAASTAFWIDPDTGISVVFATQFRFRDDFRMPLRAILGNLVYGAMSRGDTERGVGATGSRL